MDSSPLPPKPRPALGRLSAAASKLPGLGQRPAATPEPGKAAAPRPALVSFSWQDEDIENRWGIFKGGRYTSVNKVLSFSLAALISAAFIALMFALYHQQNPILKKLGQFFVRDINNLCATVPASLCFFWGVVTGLIKIPKLRLQRRALELAAVP